MKFRNYGIIGFHNFVFSSVWISVIPTLKTNTSFVDRKGKAVFHWKRLGIQAASRLAASSIRRKGGKMADSLEQDGGKGKKRGAAKAAPRQSVSKVKSTIHLSAEASIRLDIHATMMNLDRSSLVERLINEHLRRFVVSDRGGPEQPGAGEVAA